MHSALCICAEVSKLHGLSLATRLHLVMHRDEWRKTTNTGSLAARCLSGSVISVRGEGAPLARPTDLGERRGLLLFPGASGQRLTPAHAAKKPVTLFVPDGTWRQATKMCRRVTWLSELEPVTLPAGAETTYQLRRETREGGLATAEAIARAMGVLEGPEVQAALERVFRIMVDRTLFSRGLLSRDRVFGGIGDHVLQHLPGEGVFP